MLTEQRVHIISECSSLQRLSGCQGRARDSSLGSSALGRGTARRELVRGWGNRLPFAICTDRKLSSYTDCNCPKLPFLSEVCVES